MLAAEISRLRVALSGTPGVATLSLPFQELNVPLTSPAEEPTKNSTLLLGTSIVNSRPGLVRVCACKGIPEQSKKKTIVNMFFMKPTVYRVFFSAVDSFRFGQFSASLG